MASDPRHWVLEHEVPGTPCPTWHYFVDHYQPAKCGRPPIPGTPIVAELPCAMCYPTRMCAACFNANCSQNSIQREPKSTEQETENDKMRRASGNVQSYYPFVQLLYLLARDHLPIGTLEAVMDQLPPPGDTMKFTNGWLAEWAVYQLTRTKKILTR